MRIVIDTNVIASGIFFGGKPKMLLEMVVTRRLDAFVSEEILLEYQETVEELCSRYPSRPYQLPLAHRSIRTPAFRSAGIRMMINSLNAP